MPINSKESLKNLKKEVVQCKKCLDLVKTRKQPVPGDGIPNAKILIIGHYPKEKGAENSGIPFTNDSSGVFLRNVLKETGLSLQNDTYLTYLVKCTPRDIVSKSPLKTKTITPSEEHVDNCISYLTEEISITTPHILIPLGLDVSNIILDKFFSVEEKVTDMSEIHMRVFENPSFKMVPFYEPADVFIRNIVSEEKFIEDFKTLSGLLKVV